MTSRTRPKLATLLGVLATASAVGSGWADETEFVDRLSTLLLDQELDARGRLGGVTVDRLGFLYVANFRDAVWRIGPDGDVQTLSRSLYGASGNVIDSHGDLLQANFIGNSIAKITRAGELSVLANEGFSGPVGIAVDAEDNLYVCNCTGNSVVKVSPTGSVVPFAESESFACPNGITFASDGNLYLTNFNNHDILRLSPEGTVSRFANLPGGPGNAHIAFSKGFFYITKIIANRLVKVSLDGEITPLAGTGQPGHTDGNALEATLQQPNGIAVAPSGDLLYVNTVVGEYRASSRSQITVRTVELMTLTKALAISLEKGDLDEATKTYHRYKTDAVRGQENTGAEMVRFGYSLLSNRKSAEALAIFRLNAESYPDSAAAQYQLGEAFRYTGQAERAKSQYRKVLELEPTHAEASSRLAQLGVRHEISGLHRDRRGASSARRPTETYPAYGAGRATPRTGMHRRSNVSVVS